MARDARCTLRAKRTAPQRWRKLNGHRLSSRRQVGHHDCRVVTSAPSGGETAVAALAVCCDSVQPLANARAEALAIRLGVPRIDCASRGYPLLLVVTAERLELRQTDNTDGPVYSEFATGRFGYRRTLPLAQELLARAIGFKGVPLDVIDATAGLGRDAMVLLLLGCRVTAIESHPVVVELFEDGLRRARSHPELADAIDDRLRLIHDDAVAYLGSLPSGTAPDVIYLDPMFPARTQSALMKKELRLLGRLTGSGGDDGDRGADALLRAALTTGCHRIVVKRPRRSSDLLLTGGTPPAASFEGRGARFDVYIPAGAGEV